MLRKLIKTFIVCTLILTALFFILSFYKSYPDLSLEEYYKCEFSEKLKSKGDFLITENGVCMHEMKCKYLSNIVKCKNMREESGWRVVKDLNHDNFNFDFLEINESTHEIYINNEASDSKNNESLNMCNQNGVYCKKAFFLDINNKSYFLWPSKGNGRLFEVDRETFKYLGNDVYSDRDGIVEKNARILQSQ